LKEVEIHYIAIYPTGEEIKALYVGTLEEFSEFIKENELTLVDFSIKKAQLKKGKVNLDDILVLVEELHYLIGSGVHVDNALRSINKGVKKESLHLVIEEMINLLKEGNLFSVSFSKALKKENIELDKLSLSFIESAEEIGNLQLGLKQLLDYLKFKKKIRQDVKQALAYPLFLLGMSILVILFIVFVIVPKFTQMFTPQEMEKLPAISSFVLNAGEFLKENFFFVVISIFSLFFLLYLLGQKIKWIELLSKLPIFNTIIINLQLSIVYSALSKMLEGGMELDRALAKIAKMNILKELKALFTNAYNGLKKGKKLSDLFSITKLVPSNDVSLISAGENSANLAEVFDSLAKKKVELYSLEIKKLLSFLEPAIIVVLGLFIALIVTALMLAVMSITDIG